MTTLALDYGASRLIDVAVTHENGEAADITGSQFWWTAKVDWLDEEVVLAKTSGDGIEITDAPNGLAQITISADDWAGLPNEPSLYIWDLTERDADLEDWRIDRGDVHVVPAVLVPA